jgi:hypothetical protein
MPMLLPRILPTWCGTLLFAGFLGAGLHVHAQPADNKAIEKAEFERLAEIFAPPGTPSIKDKSWVTVDIGPANWKSDLNGWLIKDGAKEIDLLGWYGELHKLRKPAANEKRPSIKEEKDVGILWSAIHQADCSVAWQVRAADYGAKSKKFLGDGMPKEKDDRNIFGSVNQRFGLADHVVDSARHACYALQLGKDNHAADLYAHAVEAQKQYAHSYLGLEMPLHQFVAERIASGRCNGAICSAHGGTPRKDLKGQWESIAALPHHKYRDEAKAMVKHYGNLLDEDSRWAEPDAKALARLPVDQKIAYWLYHLRDLDVGQWSNPGSCNVLGGFGFGLGDEGRKKPNAAAELKKIGMAAVPQLIAHMDDARPTRCKGHWRRYWPEGHYLLRYGDCCKQVFEGITGQTLSPGYPIQDGAGKQCKESAEKWWQEYQKKKAK